MDENGINFVEDIESRHRGCWFEPRAMRFFRTRICDNGTVYGGRFFVTSEKGPDNVRRYSVREYDVESDRINTVGEFGAYPTLKRAITAARNMKGPNS